MNDFLRGVASCCCWGAGLFFFKFWIETRDRFFAVFGAALWILSFNWLILTVAAPPTETRHLVYLVRLAAFALILMAIAVKNRGR